MLKMGLREDIKKVTTLPTTNGDVTFYRLQELSQAAKDRKMNERKVRTPRNIELLENLDDNNADINRNSYTDAKVNPSFNKHLIETAIKEVHGGLDLSNRHWEKFWSKNLETINARKEQSQNSSMCSDVKSHSENLPEKKVSKDEPTNAKHKILNNAAILGLINTKKILLEDLFFPNNKSCVKTDDQLGIVQNGKTPSNTMTDDNYQQLIPLNEDTEILVHPLRFGLDKKKFKDIDFTVARVGKKEKETPQQYFLRTTTEDSFNFVKRTKRTK